MKICLVTTIAQHRRGADLHLKNLSWALRDQEYEILVQTYKSYGLKFSDSRIKLIESESDPLKFKFFWNETDKLLINYVKKFDLFIFMEQDILFCSKINTNIESIQLNLNSDYLSIFDKNSNILYPRLWEGCTLIKSNILIEAFENKIRLGSCKKIPNFIFDQLDNLYTTKSTKLSCQKIKEYIKNSPFVDTMFEFTLYCFLNKINVEITSENYHYGENVVHFRGCDMIVRDDPKIYDEPERMMKMAFNNRIWKRLCNGCAFLFLISGIYEKNNCVSKMILNRSQKSDDFMRKKISMLMNNSKEWMNEKEIENLNWCNKILFYNNLFL